MEILKKHKDALNENEKIQKILNEAEEGKKNIQIKFVIFPTHMDLQNQISRYNKEKVLFHIQTQGHP